MFEQMKTSYETGAQYILIFNYSEDPKKTQTPYKKNTSKP